MEQTYAKLYKMFETTCQAKLIWYLKWLSDYLQSLQKGQLLNTFAWHQLLNSNLKITKKVIM